MERWPILVALYNTQQHTQCLMNNELVIITAVRAATSHLLSREISNFFFSNLRNERIFFCCWKFEKRKGNIYIFFGFNFTLNVIDLGDRRADIIFFSSRFLERNSTFFLRHIELLHINKFGDEYSEEKNRINIEFDSRSSAKPIVENKISNMTKRVRMLINGGRNQIFPNSHRYHDNISRISRRHRDEIFGCFGIFIYIFYTKISIYLNKQRNVSCCRLLPLYIFA